MSEIMKFKEVHNPDNTVTYFMGQTSKNMKEVSKETYESLIQDDNSDNITVPKINIPEDSCNEGEYCPDCQFVLDLIDDLSEMPDNVKIEVFNNFVNDEKFEAYLEGKKDAYNEFGQGALKISLRLEDALDDFKRQMYEEID